MVGKVFFGEIAMRQELNISLPILCGKQMRSRIVQRIFNLCGYIV
jgi:hypothetical protein